MNCVSGISLTFARQIAPRGCQMCIRDSYSAAGGFCTFNGLMVTAAALRAEGLARKIGIVDCDMHYGDGTDDILAVLGAAGDDPRRWLAHYTAGEHYSRPHHAPRFFAELPGVLRSMGDCDIVLYQAGADPHIDDPLGGWLTTAELAQRDALVFAALKSLGVPVVWNLAGGYQRDDDGGISKVLLIHDNTMRACAHTFTG